MLHLRYPELLLLSAPLAFLYWRYGRVSGVTGGIRVLVLLLLVFALSGPELRLGGRGMDVIVVADRSRSLPPAAQDNIRELIKNLDNNRGPGDRVGIVTFGANANIERVPSETATFGSYTLPVVPDGTALNEAIERALTLVHRDRPARVLVLSDGEANGANPSVAARHARETGVPVDYRSFARVTIGDFAIESVLLPEVVSPREPFQFSVSVIADHDATGTLVVRREDREISRRTVGLLSGRNRVVFRDLVDEPGFPEYSVSLEVASDTEPENNVGLGAVRVDGGPRLLVLNSTGQEDNLTRAFRGAKIPYDIAVAREHPLTQDSLDQYRGVVLENVPAEDLGRLKMERLAQFTEDLGGGVLLTGGRRSFGVGGYFKSPLDEVLPVSMELREEHRKNRVAIAVALDRSGSMAVPVKGSTTKMDLANLGTAEVIKLLSPGDKVAVIAVDSSPHVIQPLSDVAEREEMMSRVRRIESEGGGIFVYEALVAAGEELMKADDYATRHIILFSDAADSEEPGDYENLLQKYAAAGITVSVIGLGSTTDPDVQLLEDIAKRGSGNIMFTNDPEELPRLFTQDTMSVARNTFLTAEEGNVFPGRIVPDVRLLGDLPVGALPGVRGYNLSYLKPKATLAAVSQDEYAAPWSAYWYRGIGRAAAITFEVDGPFTGPIRNWSGYNDFMITHARWLLSGSDPDAAFVSINRDGLDAVVSVELDPNRADRGAVPRLTVVPPGDERTATLAPELVWTGPDTLESRFRLDRTGSYRTLLQYPRAAAEGTPQAAEFSRGPAVSLPYSPEYMPRVGLPTGSKVLQDLAGLSRGIARTDVTTIFDDPPPSRGLHPLLPWLLGSAILLILAEIAGRRLSLWQRLAMLEPAPRPAGLPIPPKKKRWFEFPAKSKGAPVAQPAATARPVAQPAPSAKTPAAGPSLGDLLVKAKEKGRR